MKTLQEFILEWGFDLDKCLSPIGQCANLKFTDLLKTPIYNTMIDARGNRIIFCLQESYITLYNTGIKVLILTIEDASFDDMYKVARGSSIYTISKKLNDQYFILVNHKNRNKVEGEFVETFSWRDSKNNLEIINT